MLASTILLLPTIASAVCVPYVYLRPIRFLPCMCKPYACPFFSNMNTWKRSLGSCSQLFLPSPHPTINAPLPIFRSAVSLAVRGSTIKNSHPTQSQSSIHPTIPLILVPQSPHVVSAQISQSATFLFCHARPLLTQPTLIGPQV